MQNVLLTYLKNPSLDNFLALRGAHLAQQSLNPYAGTLIPVGKHLAAGEYQQAADLISKHLIPDYIMSAGVHLELAVAQQALGLLDKSKFEHFVAQQLVLGVEMTGHGDEKRPFLVTRTSDEYDLLIYRKQTPLLQSLVESGGRRLDRIETQSGEVLWFDVTEIYALMPRSNRR